MDTYMLTRHLNDVADGRVREVRAVTYVEVTVEDWQLQELLDSELVSPLVDDVYFLETGADYNLPDWLYDVVMAVEAAQIEEIRISANF